MEKLPIPSSYETNPWSTLPSSAASCRPARQPRSIEPWRRVSLAAANLRDRRIGVPATWPEHRSLLRAAWWALGVARTFGALLGARTKIGQLDRLDAMFCLVTWPVAISSGTNKAVVRAGRNRGCVLSVLPGLHDSVFWARFSARIWDFT
jgi:hypothetical protein